LSGNQRNWKIMIRICLSLLLIIFLTSDSIKLRVVVKNVQVGKGSVFVAVYNDEKNFLKKAFVEKELASSNSQLECFFDLSKGEYAVVVYQDINDNKKLDLGLFSIPKEPTGFSNNFHPRFSKPQFKDASIELKEPSDTSIIELK